ncbi:MAG: GTP-binding nuclear protein RAN [Solivirus sp.]|uniref:GTP-binding nuclear protein RAN n=1 Tax=Solivirus sp. TaxID=2487772 RepID=A0A3G5AFE6_9VIRU|nr:MAG: GTP-binding nuclear protein RAN [Solivirus sp.]
MQSISKKLVLVGDGMVGKTHFTYRACDMESQCKICATLGVEVHPFINSDGKMVAIWDTAGQERYGGLRDGYYIAKDAFIVFCSLKDEKSIDRVEFWINEVNRTDVHETSTTHTNVKFAIVCMGKDFAFDHPENVRKWMEKRDAYQARGVACYTISALSSEKNEFVSIVNSLF